MQRIPIIFTELTLTDFSLSHLIFFINQTGNLDGRLKIFDSLATVRSYVVQIYLRFEMLEINRLRKAQQEC